MWSSSELVQEKNGWSLVRRMYVQTDKLTFLRDKCVSCDICSTCCPKDALKLEKKEGVDRAGELGLVLDPCGYRWVL